VGGVYGKHVKYVDADILERWLKGKSKADRYTIAQPDEIPTVLMYYVDNCDRDKVIKEKESAILDAMDRRDFKRCSELQQYVDFLKEGFSKLQYESKFESVENEEDFTPTKNLAHFDCYRVKPLTKRASLRDVFPDSNNQNAKLPPTNEKTTTMHINDVVPKEKVKDRLENFVCNLPEAKSKIEPERISTTPENSLLKEKLVSRLESRDTPQVFHELNECKTWSNDSHLEGCVPTALEEDCKGTKPGLWSSSRLSRSYYSTSHKQSHHHSRGSTPSDWKSMSESTSHNTDNVLLMKHNSQVNTSILSKATEQGKNMECYSKENMDIEKFDTDNGNYLQKEGCKIGTKANVKSESQSALNAG